MTLSGNEETFDDQYNRILSLMAEPSSLLANYTEIAQAEFDLRILKCVRIGRYIDSDTPTFFLPSAKAISTESSTRISTLPAKILLSARDSDWAVLITWDQMASTVFGSSDLGYARAPIFAFLSINCDFPLDTQNLSRVDENCPATRLDLSPGIFEHTFTGSGRHLYILFAHEYPSGISMSPTIFQFIGVQLLVFESFV
jgi:hypothetical protein